MTLQLNITLSDETYEQLTRYAHARNQNVAEAVADYLEQNPPPLLTAVEAQQAADLQREKQAFLALYPVLQQQFLGHYVAILNQQLLDHDPNYSALYERVRLHHAHQIVWVSQVQSTPLPDIAMRSPRLEQIK